MVRCVNLLLSQVQLEFSATGYVKTRTGVDGQGAIELGQGRGRHFQVLTP